MLQLPPALHGLTSYAQFMLYEVTQDGDKLKKVTVHHETGRHHDAHDRAMWMTADIASQWAEHYNGKYGKYGIAFILADTDPFFFLDIDKCNEGGKWSTIANTMLSAFQGCAVEVSTSGNGLHIIGSGVFPDHAKRNKELGIELYTEKRLIALTGTDAVGDVNARVSPELAQWLVDYYFKPRERFNSADWDAGPCAEWNGPTDDDDLIRRACNAVSARRAFSGQAGFFELWTADAAALARTYPPEDKGVWDGSAVDMALAMHLAFWTGRDCARMERLMRRSALVREKWERSDYLPDTISNACEMSKEVCQDKKPESAALATAQPSISVPVGQPPTSRAIASFAPAARLTEGSTYLSPSDQVEFFKGCVHVIAAGQNWVPGVGLLSPSRFNAMFGGYSFVLDRENSKLSHDAHDTFTNSRAVRFPKVYDQCFRPDLPSGEIVTINNENFLNTYRPLEITMREGDPSPFLIHLAKLLPNEKDRMILLCYLAALVQHRGTKFRWTPIVQGVEGNGKTFISMAATFAVGPRYTHWPAAAKLGNQFNSWMYRRLLYCVEDFGPAKNRDEVMEQLKPMITGENLEIEGKGIDQENREICGNFLINTNHKGAARKTKNDRRLCVLYTAQQHVDDLARDGLDETYMTNLHEWAKGIGPWESHGADYGFSVIAHYLANFDIPDTLNPAKRCQRAPLTSATSEAILDSMGTVEQNILEAVAEGREGFRGDFISGKYLRQMLEGSKHNISPHRRETILRSLGYVPHPALREGRPDVAVLPDAMRSILYVRMGSVNAALETQPLATLAYSSAQAERD